MLDNEVPNYSYDCGFVLCSGHHRFLRQINKFVIIRKYFQIHWRPVPTRHGEYSPRDLEQWETRGFWSSLLQTWHHDEFPVEWGPCRWSLSSGPTVVMDQWWSQNRSHVHLRWSQLSGHLSLYWHWRQCIMLTRDKIIELLVCLIFYHFSVANATLELM